MDFRRTFVVRGMADTSAIPILANTEEVELPATVLGRPAFVSRIFVAIN
jgi:hypothetical protein